MITEFGAEELRPEEVAHAHQWWMELPSEYKARSSIWVILALYARVSVRDRVAVLPVASRKDG